MQRGKKIGQLLHSSFRILASPWLEALGTPLQQEAGRILL